MEIDPDLTDPTAEPVAPVPLCVDSEGAFVLCDSQVVTWLLAYRGALAEANADKRAISVLGEREAGHD